MTRSVGVTLSAIVSLIGSVLTLGLGVLFVAVFFVIAPIKGGVPGFPGAAKFLFVGIALVYILPAIWGITTSIGLLQFKNWARISLIVFSVILILMGVMAGIMMLLIPLPATTQNDQSVVTFVRWGMGGFWFFLVGVGTWWLILFTRAKVKAQFVSVVPMYGVGGPSQIPALPVPAAAQASSNQRPVSITVIAWLLLAGCLFIPMSLLLHAPVIFFTKLFTGYAAAAYLLLLVGVHLYAGIGLLRLNPIARITAIGYYVFGLLNVAVFYLAPGGRDRLRALLDASQAMFPWTRGMQQSVPSVDPMPFAMMGSVIGLVGAVIPVYFLITRQKAFASKQS